MKIAGNYTINAPQDQVWAALNDIEVLARIVPGCERLEQTGENEFRGTVKIGIQSIKGTYSGRIRLEDIQPPRHYRLVANGRSANGVVDGSGTVDLVEQDGKTILSYTGDAQIGGTLASVGQRLIEGASRQMINQSLKALAEQIAERAAKSDAGDEVGTPPSGAASEDATLAMPWPFPGSTHPSITPEAPIGGSSEATLSAASEDTSIKAPEGASETAMPWPFPGSTHPSITSEAPTGGLSATAPTAPGAVPSPSPPPFAPRTVVVPEHEQLKPETILRGAVEDLLKERPWMPTVVIAFLLGYLLGRLRR